MQVTNIQRALSMFINLFHRQCVQYQLCNIEDMIEKYINENRDKPM